MDVFAGSRLFCVRGERLVVADLEFRMASGEALVLRGPNGSGKSSLLRLMAGLSRPAGGTLSWNGSTITADPEAHRARVHYVGHLDATKPVLTVHEQLATWGQMRGMGAAEATERAAAALEQLGIRQLADLPGRYLSAGQRRRLNLARILAMDAQIWLLDEPHTALDAAAVARVADAIGRHRAKGGMVAVALHGPEEPAGARTLDLSAFAPDEDHVGQC